VSEVDDIQVRRIQAYVCDLCLSGAGGECHVPGCSFFIWDAPVGRELETLRRWRAHTELLEKEVAS
jgi:hypothetical protein